MRYVNIHFVLYEYFKKILQILLTNNTICIMINLSKDIAVIYQILIFQIQKEIFGLKEVGKYCHTSDKLVMSEEPCKSKRH